MEPMPLPHMNFEKVNSIVVSQTVLLISANNHLNFINVEMSALISMNVAIYTSLSRHRQFCLDPHLHDLHCPPGSPPSISWPIQLLQT